MGTMANSVSLVWVAPSSHRGLTQWKGRRGRRGRGHRFGFTRQEHSSSTRCLCQLDLIPPALYPGGRDSRLGPHTDGTAPSQGTSHDPTAHRDLMSPVESRRNPGPKRTGTSNGVSSPTRQPWCLVPTQRHNWGEAKLKLEARVPKLHGEEATRHNWDKEVNRTCVMTARGQRTLVSRT